MSYVLYYSKYCDNCKKILFKIGKDKIKDDIHFLCIDKRKKVKDKVYIVLSDGKVHDYESSLIRRLSGLLYISDVNSGNAKKKALDKINKKL